MALYDQLPVFKTSYDLLLKLYEMISLLPKEHKYTLGEKLKTIVLNLIIGIYQANTTNNKQPIIAWLLQEIEMIKILIRVCRDIRIIAIPQYADISILVDSVAKQLRWWERSMK